MSSDVQQHVVDVVTSPKVATLVSTGTAGTGIAAIVNAFDLNVTVAVVGLVMTVIVGLSTAARVILESRRASRKEKREMRESRLRIAIMEEEKVIKAAEAAKYGYRRKDDEKK